MESLASYFSNSWGRYFAALGVAIAVALSENKVQPRC